METNMENVSHKKISELSQTLYEFDDLFIGFVKAIVNAFEAKTPWTRGHSERVTAFAQEIACEMKLGEKLAKEVTIASLLHDIGKIGDAGNILEKGSGLSQSEYNSVKKYPVQGADILRGIHHFEDVASMVRHHHERMDGTGYPDKLKGDKIPIGARIISVADAFDAMTEGRPYRPSMSIEEALSELRKNGGTQFDPSVVDAWIRVLDRQKNWLLPSKSLSFEDRKKFKDKM
jgi:putative nucleotidyltransferase with HDIG domain